MGRMKIKGRKYYHEGREPKVLILINETVCTGYVTDFWDNGLCLSVDSRLGISPGDIVPRLYFDAVGMREVIEGMTVMHCNFDETTGKTHLAVCTSGAKVENQFREAFHRLWDRPAKNIAQIFGEDTIPKFLGSEHYSETSVKTRLGWASKISGSQLDSISKTIMKAESLAGNIENYIGAVQIPVGIAGPILINGVYANGFIPVPIATTEGALVSSISRGARVCNLAGGIETHVIEQKMQRVPVFFCRDMQGALNLQRWVEGHKNKIIAKAEGVSSIARIKYITPEVYGEAMHLNFTFSTGDAAGQNMTTSCTWVACEWIVEQILDNASIGFMSYNIDGNMSADKKVSFNSFIKGRGISVQASCFIPGRLLKDKLRTNYKDYARHYHEGEFSAQRVGIVGMNINFANPIAGIFTATGQDIACVHESSVGIFKVREQDKGILFTAYLPSLVIGTVGGGTKLPTQRECLELMNCAGPGKSFRLAEIIAAACLSLDISTGSAMTSNEFASAHDRFGRNRPTKYLSRADITTDFFNSMMFDKGSKVVSFEEGKISSDSSMITKTVKSKSKKFQGLFKYDLKIESESGIKDLPAILKLKTTDTEIIDIGIGLARLSGEDRLPGLFESQVGVFGFGGSHEREIAFYNLAEKDILSYCPEIYGSYKDASRNAYAVLMEDLSSASHLDTVNRPSLWDSVSIENVLFDLAGMHTVYIDSFDKIPEEINVNNYTEKNLVPATDLLSELTSYNARRFPELLTKPIEKICHKFLGKIPAILNEMQSFPMTLTHNDFNVRNICLRKDGGKGPRLVLYDWEVPCWQNPQLDLVEFLVYCLPGNATRGSFTRYVSKYMKNLEAWSDKALEKKVFEKVLYLNAIKLAVIRFNLYLLAHNVLKFPYMDRVYGNLRTLITAGSETFDI